MKKLILGIADSRTCCHQCATGRRPILGSVVLWTTAIHNYATATATAMAIQATATATAIQATLMVLPVVTLVGCIVGPIAVDTRTPETEQPSPPAPAECRVFSG